MKVVARLTNKQKMLVNSWHDHARASSSLATSPQRLVDALSFMTRSMTEKTCLSLICATLKRR